MTFELRFHAAALNEWKRLDNSIRLQFKAKLAERLENPRIPSAALSGMPNCYNIKLQRVGYRLVYRVDDEVVFVTVIAVGKRDKLEAYAKARKRLS